MTLTKPMVIRAAIMSKNKNKKVVYGPRGHVTHVEHPPERAKCLQGDLIRNRYLEA